MLHSGGEEPVAGGAFGSWAFSRDLLNLIHLLVPPLSFCNYWKHQYYTKMQYKKAWHYREKGILFIKGEWHFY